MIYMDEKATAIRLTCANLFWREMLWYTSQLLLLASPDCFELD